MSAHIENLIALIRRKIEENGVRKSLLLMTVVGALLVWYAVTSNHPLAGKFWTTIRFEYGNKILSLILLYGMHRLFNSQMRSHKLFKELGNKVSSPIYVAWCSIWVLACAHIIASVG